MKIAAVLAAHLIAAPVLAQTPAPTSPQIAPRPASDLTRSLNSGPPFAVVPPPRATAPSAAPTTAAPIPTTPPASAPRTAPITPSWPAPTPRATPMPSTVPPAPVMTPRTAPPPVATIQPPATTTSASAPALRPAAPAPTTPLAVASTPAPPAMSPPAEPAPEPPAMTVLDATAMAALPFTAELPAGFRITTGRPGPDFKIYTIRRGDQSFVTIYAGPASQFPIYTGQMAEVAGRASVVVDEDGRRRAVEHLFQRQTAPREIHVWVSSLEGQDQVLAELIGQSIDAR